jgi:hypothetical protein
MMLKFDIYAKLVDDYLIVTEIAPQKHQYKIEIPPEDIAEVSSFVKDLYSGEFNGEASLSNNETVKQIYHFFEKKGFFASYFADEHLNNPFSRQLERFESFVTPDTTNMMQVIENAQDRLSNATVCVIGAGGVGTALANSLISCGVGRLIIVDSDTIEISNLSRQFLYNKDDVGLSKVTVLARKLNARGLGEVIPVNKMVSHSNIDNLLREYPDIQAVTGTPFPFEKFIDEMYMRILNKNIPVFSIGEHDAGPMITTVEQLRIARDFLLRDYPLMKDMKKRREVHTVHVRHPSFLPELMITSALVTNEIIRYLIGLGGSRFESSMYSLSALTNEVRLVKISDGE